MRRWYARMPIDRDACGDRNKARELLMEAVVMYRDTGMPAHRDGGGAIAGDVRTQ